MERLPIGISDYKELIEGGYYYVDKTLLVKEFMDTDGKILLVPRPRRFGKTLNLSMLRYFFDPCYAYPGLPAWQATQDRENKTRHLFADTAIWQKKEYRELQGTYPVIFLTFKGIKESTWNCAYEKFINIISREFERHKYLLEESMPSHTAEKYRSILERRASRAIVESSLSFLAELLYNYHNKNVIILLDEYDVPIHAAYSKGYYQDMMDFIRPLLEDAFKDNTFLARGFISGILRVAKEGVFTGLNNLKVCSFLNTEFQDKFGFTESEVNLLLKDQKLTDKACEIKDWYNGYTCGSTKIYNPWSIVQCADQRGLLKPYWVNTSDNAMVDKLIAYADEGVKRDLEALINHQSVTKEIDEGIVLSDLEYNESSLWTLLMCTGYLSFAKQDLIEGITMCDLVVPNKEIKIVYNNLIKNIFQKSLTNTKITTLLKALTEGNSLKFGELFQEFVMNSMSFYDFSVKEPEKSYNLFVLGLLAYLSDTHEIKSNRESGEGRYDIMIIPRQANMLATVIEFKKVENKEKLEAACQRALEQIKSKNYVRELKNRNMKKIQLLGIAFKGKKILVQVA